jgi:hypothetical protein
MRRKLALAFSLISVVGLSTPVNAEIVQLCRPKTNPAIVDNFYSVVFSGTKPCKGTYKKINQVFDLFDDSWRDDNGNRYQLFLFKPNRARKIRKQSTNFEPPIVNQPSRGSSRRELKRPLQLTGLEIAIVDPQDPRWCTDKQDPKKDGCQTLGSGSGG